MASSGDGDDGGLYSYKEGYVGDYRALCELE